MDARNTLSKKERLSSKDGLDSLFMSGHYGTEPPLRYCYNRFNGLPYNRIVVSVPKKFFKRAVKRNLLKRRLREAYRLNKALLPVCGTSVEAGRSGGTDLSLVYATREVLAQEQITALVVSVLKTVAGL